MPLVSSIIARILVIVDAISVAFISTSVSVDNLTNPCGPQTNISVTFTPCGQTVLSFTRQILVGTPLSIISFWLPALNAVLAGLSAVKV